MPATSPLLPVTLQPGNVRYAPGVRAGRWLFATGHKGTEVAGFDAYQSDSLLLTPTVYCSEGESKMHLSFNTQPLGTSVTADSPALFTVSYAGAFPL